MNYTDKIFELLGVEAGEEFKVKGHDECYKFNSDLIILQKNKDGNWYYGKFAVSLRSILDGTSEIVKIPHPTERDREILKAGKTLGFTHAAKDEDGTIFLYAEKPGKRGHDWLASTTNSMRLFNLNPDDLAFIRWEDAEPVDLEGIV